MADAQRIYLANRNAKREAKVHEEAHNSSTPLAQRSSLVSKKRDPGAAPGKVVHIQYPKDQVIPPRSAPRYCELTWPRWVKWKPI